jgi:DNA-directed RNA polymerase subunit omega
MDEATIQRLAMRAGGRFKLCSLVIKRLTEINRGSQLLIEPPSDNLLEAVLKEVELDLVRLIPRLPAPAEEVVHQLAQGTEAAAEAAEAKAEPAAKKPKAKKAGKKK